MQPTVQAQAPSKTRLDKRLKIPEDPKLEDKEIIIAKMALAIDFGLAYPAEGFKLVLLPSKKTIEVNPSSPRSARPWLRDLKALPLYRPATPSPEPQCAPFAAAPALPAQPR